MVTPRFYEEFYNMATGAGPVPHRFFCRFGMAYFGYGHGRLRGRAVTATAIQKKGVLCGT